MQHCLSDSKSKPCIVCCSLWARFCKKSFISRGGDCLSFFPFKGFSLLRILYLYVLRVNLYTFVIFLSISNFRNFQNSPCHSFFKTCCYYKIHSKVMGEKICHILQSKCCTEHPYFFLDKGLYLCEAETK